MWQAQIIPLEGGKKAEEEEGGGKFVEATNQSSRAACSVIALIKDVGTLFRASRLLFRAWQRVNSGSGMIVAKWTVSIIVNQQQQIDSRCFIILKYPRDTMIRFFLNSLLEVKELLKILDIR